MAAPPNQQAIPTPASAAPVPAFFVNQQIGGMGAPAKNISESPILATPQSANSGSANKGIQTPGSKGSKKKIYLGVGIAVMVLLVVGGGAGLYLSSTKQDTRQQASSTTGTARMSVSPSSGTLKGDSAQTIPVTLDLASTPISFSEITFAISLTGELPSDIQFKPENLSGFSPADVSLVDASGGKTLTVSFKSSASGSFTSSAAKVNLGDITFTTPSTGQLVLRFLASESKAIVKQSGADILRPPSLITYTFQPSATATPTTDAEVVNATDSASTVASTSASRSAQLASANTTPTRTPTLIPGTGGGDGTQALAGLTKTPTPTVASTSATTKTPTPTTASRNSSQPAQTQEKPVSGSATDTLLLIVTGIFFIFAGLSLFPKKQPTDN